MNYRIQRVSGSDVSYWMSFIRFFIHALLLAFISFFLNPALSSIITPLLFLIFGLCSKMKQLPHDMETKTVMVYAKSTLSTKIKNRILTYILIAVILVILFAAYTAIAELA